MFVQLGDHIGSSIKIALDIVQGVQQGLELLVAFCLERMGWDARQVHN